MRETAVNVIRIIYAESRFPELTVNLASRRNVFILLKDVIKYSLPKTQEIVELLPGRPRNSVDSDVINNSLVLLFCR